MAGAKGPGVFLRERREAKGMSIADISSATRIAPRFLEALERDRLEALPAAVFVRGFIRAYCAVVDAPAEGPLEAYEQKRQALTPAATPAPVVATPPPAAAAPRRPHRATPPAVRPFVVVAGLGIVLAALAAYFLVSSGEAPRPAAPAVQPAAPVATPSGPPVAPSDAAIPARTRSEAPPRSGRVLVVRAHEPTWVWVRPDDASPTQEILQPGTVRRWRSPRRFIVTVGNAGGVLLELDGVPLPPLGKPGEVVRERTIPAEPRS